MRVNRLPADYRYLSDAETVAHLMGEANYPDVIQVRDGYASVSLAVPAAVPVVA